MSSIAPNFWGEGGKPQREGRHNIIYLTQRHKEHKADKEEILGLGAKIYKTQKQINISNKYNIVILNLIQELFVNAILKYINEYNNCSFQANHLRIAMLTEISLRDPASWPG